MVPPGHNQCVIVNRGPRRRFWDNGDLWHPCPPRGSCSMYQSSFISFAQGGEAVLPGCAMNDVPRGFCIDVSVLDPIGCSVAKAFYERGWHDIDSEPCSTGTAV